MKREWVTKKSQATKWIQVSSRDKTTLTVSWTCADLLAKSAKVELIRFTPVKDESNKPVLEEILLNEDIPDDGGFVIPLEMNMDFIYTNEFGENEITNDPNKGVATSACYRARININDNDLSRVRQNADFLIPNIREYGSYNNSTTWTIDDKSYAWSLDWDDYPTTAVSNDGSLGILYNENGKYFPKDYFYRFNYNKVYTVSSFQSSYHNDNLFTKDRFIGLKELVPNEEEDCGDNLTPPVNFGLKNYTFTLLIANVLLFFEQLINVVTLTFFNTIARVFHGLADAVDFFPIKRLSRSIRKFAYRIQDS
jgi:hypothetical protein